MLYTSDNVEVSLTVDFAARLRLLGYDVLWQESGETEVQTLGLPVAKAVVTLVHEFPANPRFLTRLKSVNAGEEEVVVPAFVLRVINEPREREALGIGMTERYWERRCQLDGFAIDEFQQRQLATAIHDWMLEVPGKNMPISDWDSNATSPPALEPAYIVNAGVERRELQMEIDAVRYYITATFYLRYVE